MFPCRQAEGSEGLKSTEDRLSTRFVPVRVPLWREMLVALDWVALHASPVYRGSGIPHGDGAPVVLIPGFLSTDAYLTEMHRWLGRIGYRPYLSNIGHNAECPNILTKRLVRTMNRAFRETGRKVQLVGHSLGGVIALSAAGRRPSRVAQVITMGSPVSEIRAHPMVLAMASFVRGRVQWRHRSRVEPQCYTAECTCEFVRSLRRGLAPAIRRTSIYTKTDGIVDWRSCLCEDEGANIEVSSTHGGLAFNAAVFREIAFLLSPDGRLSGDE
jgi:triacylglycerol lipase